MLSASRFCSNAGRERDLARLFAVAGGRGLNLQSLLDLIRDGRRAGEQRHARRSSAQVEDLWNQAPCAIASSKAWSAVGTASAPRAVDRARRNPRGREAAAESHR